MNGKAKRLLTYGYPGPWLNMSIIGRSRYGIWYVLMYVVEVTGGIRRAEHLISHSTRTGIIECKETDSPVEYLKGVGKVCRYLVG